MKIWISKDKVASSEPVWLWDAPPSHSDGVWVSHATSDASKGGCPADADTLIALGLALPRSMWGKR